MSPLREVSNWKNRYERDEKIEPLSRYYILFEGSQTERKYFTGLDNNRRDIGINNLIELVILNKIGDIRTHSHPKKLLEIIKEKINDIIEAGELDDQDRFVLVFDRDSFKDEEEFRSYLLEVNAYCVNLRLAVTSPCFEIWLILHFDNSVHEHILPNYPHLLENKKISNKHSYASKLLSDIANMNPKSSFRFSRFKDNINLAIEQEKFLENNIEKMASAVGSNIGHLIELLKEDPRKQL